jgi:beta-phosphoglucomutase
LTSPLRAIVFDFDGVLADSEPLHLRAAQQVLEPRGVRLTSEEYYARYLGLDDRGMFEAIGREKGLPIAGEAIAALIAEKTRRFDALIEGDDGGLDGVLFPGAAACVRRLAAAVPLAIASGALPGEIEAVLRRAGLGTLFTAVVAAGDTPNSKPAPDPYRLAVERLAAHRTFGGAPPPPETVVAIEDSRWGLESARAAGLRTAAVTHTYPAAQLPGADAIFDSLEEITVGRLQALVQGDRGQPAW